MSEEITNQTNSVFIGTLYSGENDFDQCVRSLQSQTYCCWEHEVYKNLPNKVAHTTLYQEFMDRSDEFDLFLKLDADMVFQDSTSLARIVKIFDERSSLDHLQMVVHDWFSNSSIMGLHIFSNRAVWHPRNEELFVDYPPSIPGKRWRLWGSPAPLVIHSPNPSPLQAFRFGLHRATKALQPERRSLALDHAKVQWQILKSVWKHFAETGDRRLGLAVLGAELVFRGKATHLHYGIENELLESIWAPNAEMSADELRRVLRPYWSNPVARELRFAAHILPRVFHSSVLRFGRRALRFSRFSLLKDSLDSRSK